MKITKTELAKIIREELQNVKELEAGDDNPECESLDNTVAHLVGLAECFTGDASFQGVDADLKQQVLAANTALRELIEQVRNKIPRRIGLEPGV